ncbi:nucleotide sugar dehydrogenase [Candidatus Methanocrinis natronophilus]|uniref:UDP-N-acetyl-D-mannosamine dehydrogenase n=1 Tax=Candidatus Methanocrinis natronophilus TaxID=3033396 RepID=A0ABT5X9R9_9EURY|nr:nucleotide sugar dehydrogenase [Candidatus Methanocrinis natronophilus]MDF0591415.1 nucleotide sugar dehydrogenase [Candidatus Methanocrinis natronophilus]
MNIAVVGLGNAGLPLASVIADCGFEVIGVDIDMERCERINRGINPIPEEAGLDDLIERYGGKSLRATPRYEDAKGCKSFIVIVPLLIDEGHNPDFNILEEAFRSIGKILKKGDLVVLETTVPPTTTETMIRGWLEEESGLQLGDFYLAHSPERIMTGYSISRLREFPKIVGGADEESGRLAFDLYRKFIPNLQRVTSSRVAEFVKIVEGCYRDVNIALANEILKISEELNIDFNEAREYANHDYCHIHLPSTGVGGHCIPVYPWFLINEMEKREKFGFVELQRCSRKINDEMVGYWAERIVLKALKIDRPLSQIKICLRGITYRKGVKELYHSRNLALARVLARKGLQVGVYDELFSEEEIESLSLRFMDPEDADVVFDCFELRFS